MLKKKLRQDDPSRETFERAFASNRMSILEMLAKHPRTPKDILLKLSQEDIWRSRNLDSNTSYLFKDVIQRSLCSRTSVPAELHPYYANLYFAPYHANIACLENAAADPALLASLEKAYLETMGRSDTGVKNRCNSRILSDRGLVNTRLGSWAFESALQERYYSPLDSLIENPEAPTELLLSVYQTGWYSHQDKKKMYEKLLAHPNFPLTALGKLRFGSLPADLRTRLLDQLTPSQRIKAESSAPSSTLAEVLARVGTPIKQNVTPARSLFDVAPFRRKKAAPAPENQPSAVERFEAALRSAERLIGILDPEQTARAADALNTQNAAFRKAVSLYETLQDAPRTASSKRAIRTSAAELEQAAKDVEDPLDSLVNLSACRPPGRPLEGVLCEIEAGIQLSALTASQLH